MSQLQPNYITSGHQIGIGASLPSTSTNPAIQSKSTRSPTKFSPHKAAAAEPSTSVASIKSDHHRAAPSSTNAKGKAKAVSPLAKPSEDIETASEEYFEEESEEEIKPKRQGRPCKDILKDAAKRMKQL
ncbi:hypothetical protein PTTG_05397 [Puccinia triticina 1-1 BBBD Race 1]|uniref:Uncharacterized protein n=1 Tax=Puccinia triticina (isolate 1-1 / race 1 (BBBD)) TaxID=630390 RepID=A0A180GK01_PUCT1|nr:hypothetical protein PTTG_05397 [Puccinia triticina 1-1 BBBD Race 1]